MSDDRSASDEWHRRQYEAALRCAEVTGSSWDDLTEDQRKTIRRINLESQRTMDAIAGSLAEGKPVKGPL